MRYQQEIV